MIVPMLKSAGLWCVCSLLATSFLVIASDAPPKRLPLRQPAVRSVFPLGGKAGRTVPVEIEGEFLDRASVVRCECADVSGAVRQSSALRLTADFNIPEAAEPGLRTMYLESPRGTSNRFFFRVTRWDSVRENEPNDQFDQAQVV